MRGSANTAKSRSAFCMDAGASTPAGSIFSNARVAQRAEAPNSNLGQCECNSRRGYFSFPTRWSCSPTMAEARRRDRRQCWFESSHDYHFRTRSIDLEAAALQAAEQVTTPQGFTNNFPAARYGILRLQPHSGLVGSTPATPAFQGVKAQTNYSPGKLF
jgi:hypothetical protein